MGHGCTGVARGSRRLISESAVLRGNQPRKANCQSDAVPTSKSQSLSLLLHGVALAALLALNSRVLLRTPMLPAHEKTNRLTFVPPRVSPPSVSANAAGGSQSAPQAARHGAPPPALKRYFIPPATNADPKLPLPLSLDFEAPTVVLAASDFGDPYGKMAGHSMGTGGGSRGIGNSGCCGGVGNDSDGASMGGGAGHSITAPKLIYKVEPEFSEEARKAKFQGTVVLSVEVDVNGRPTHLLVVSSPGLGLDARALDAVAQWRFRPAYRDGRPFAATARIEVSFHLL